MNLKDAKSIIIGSGSTIKDIKKIKIGDNLIWQKEKVLFDKETGETIDWSIRLDSGTHQAQKSGYCNVNDQEYLELYSSASTYSWQTDDGMECNIYASPYDPIQFSQDTKIIFNINSLVKDSLNFYIGDELGRNSIAQISVASIGEFTWTPNVEGNYFLTMNLYSGWANAGGHSTYNSATFSRISIE